MDELFWALAEISAMIREASVSKERTRRAMFLIAATSVAVVTVSAGLLLFARLLL